MRRAALAVVLVGLVAVPAAAAKDGVVARLTGPLADRPAGGVRVGFVLEERATGERFSAQGIFVRARTVDGQGVEVNATEISSMGGGEFEALIPARRDRIADLEIGLAGISSGPSGTQRSDAMFPIEDDPFPGTPEATASGDLSSTLVYALIAALGAVALALAIRRVPRRLAT